VVLDDDDLEPVAEGAIGDREVGLGGQQRGHGHERGRGEGQGAPVAVLHGAVRGCGARWDSAEGGRVVSIAAFRIAALRLGLSFPLTT
jgi:hypothetical protein